jgi:hypothetical protein
MSAPHAAVKHELLVRHLDAWTPAALHGHKRVTYVEAYADDGGGAAGASAVAALRVFGEFADLLEQHKLTMVLVGADVARLDVLAKRLSEVAAEYDSPPGLSVHTAAGGCARSLVPALKQTRALGSPIFGWFDSYGSVAPPFAAVSAVAGNKSSEVMLSLDPTALGGTAPYPRLVSDYRRALGQAGLGLATHVELVDEDGRAELLVFATSSEKGLEKFKDDLWALDEYAGIRYRDPRDEDHTLLDISLQANLGPLRRALSERIIHIGESTVALLRAWAVRETLYRARDATRAVQALVAAGVVERSPTGGRLSPDTIIRPTGSPIRPTGSAGAMGDEDG